MCGVAGIFAKESRDLSFIKDMCDIVRHRGPDDAGYAIFGSDLQPTALGCEDTVEPNPGSDLAYLPSRTNRDAFSHPSLVALGHRRLSIVDKSYLGHQPMCIQDERYWISYNGEIYNYMELRSELEGLGHVFATRTDTEIVLAAYALWGVQCLHRFNGMWGFVILDRLTRTLFMARDRFGVKPLYYWVSQAGLLATGSEIKQFTSLPGWRAKLNGQRAYDFLAWFPIDHTDETLFQGVYQLRPGTFAQVQIDTWHGVVDTAGRIPVTQWYKLGRSQSDTDWLSAQGRFHGLFGDAVSARLSADVPVGFSLSGGIDSSAVVCMAATHDSGLDLKTFSMCPDDESLSERHWMNQVILQTGAYGEFCRPTGRTMLENLPQIIWQQDEPFGSPAIFAHWQIMHTAAQKGIKVLLVGQGGDESYAGYDTFFAPMIRTLVRQGRWGQVAREIGALARSRDYSYSALCKLLMRASLPPRVSEGYGDWRDEHRLAPPWLNTQRLRAEPRDPLKHCREIRVGSVSNLSETLLTVCASPMMLHAEDRNSMAHGIETRAPFMDFRLIEFALSLPDSFKVHNGVTKRIVRDSMSGILPDAIRQRKDKVGMGTPNAAWFWLGGEQGIRERMHDAVEASQGVINSNVFDFAYAAYHGRRPFDLALWRVVCFGAWMKQFGVTA